MGLKLGVYLDVKFLLEWVYLIEVSYGMVSMILGGFIVNIKLFGNDLWVVIIMFNF